MRRLFDSHCHIIDARFPLVPNNGFVPDHFPVEDYQQRTRELGVQGGAVVSGSFQAFDQGYLEDALPKMGPNWVGVTQIPFDCPDEEIARLNGFGVRAVRFNCYRGEPANMDDIEALARRCHSVAGWHAEFYADAAALRSDLDRLLKLPRISLDHLGMSAEGLPVLVEIAKAGGKVKATGFGRTQADIPKTLETLASAHPGSIVVGTDLPSTRAKRPFEAADLALIEHVLGPELAGKAFWDNAVELYRIS